MKALKFLMKIAASAALAGVLLVVVGFALGARPSDSRGWDYGPFTFGGGIFDVTDHDDHDDHDGWDDLDDLIEDTAAASRAQSRAQTASTAAPSAAQPVQAASSGAQSAAQTQQSAAQTQQTYLYHSLEIETGASAVVIQTGDDFRVTGDGVNWSEENDKGTLKVETYRMQAGTLTVTVPSDLTLRELEVSVGAGSLSMSGVSCEEGSFSVGAGEIAIDSTTVVREADFEIGMGKLTYGGTLSGKTSIECGVGSVSISVANPGDFGYDVELAGGTVNIGGDAYSGMAQQVRRSPGAAVYYEIECGLGEVNVSFA